MPQNRIEDPRAYRGVIGRAALGTALAALFVCANSAVLRAQDVDSDEPSYYDRFMRAIGLQNPGSLGDGINYTERSPLVVPPTRDLPPPQASTAPPVPDWPKDADIKRREKAKAEKKVGPRPDYVIDSSRALRPDELNAKGAPAAGAPTQNPAPDAQASQPPPPKKGLFSFSFFKKEEYATFTGEPVRESLTDPPPGYLTPSPDQPYGIAPEKKPVHVPTLAERVEPVR